MLKKVYLASGWFSPEWDQEVTDIRDTLLKNGFEPFVPRDFFICPPNADEKTQQETFDGNLKHLKTSGFLIANTRAKDMGTIFEAGYFKGWNQALEMVGQAFDKPIIYFCAGLPKGATFNLMLSRSGVKVCTSIQELDEYLGRCVAAGKLLVELYGGQIE